MFASLKSKIKEETGSDLGKLTSSWRSGSFLGRISQREESSTTTPSSSGGVGDSTSESITPQLEAYLSERTGGSVDQASLQEHYTSQLEAKLVERDAYWERKIEEMQLSQASVQGEEAAAAQAVARNAQAEAAKAAAERDSANKQLGELRERLAAAERAQERLDILTEELEESRRQWARERSSLNAALGAAEARGEELAGELAVVRAAAPPSAPHHHMADDDKALVHPTGCEDYDKLQREKAVLSRQLQEAKMALADVKTSWSGQIASLETQEKAMEAESRLEAVLEEMEELRTSLENERTLVKILQEKVEKTNRMYDEKGAEVERAGREVAELRAECRDMQRRVDKERREKDEALLRNAHISQSMEMSQCSVRYHEEELAEVRARSSELERLLAQHKENQAECMLIKQNDEALKQEIEQLKKRVDALGESEATLKKTIQEFEAEICDKNKKIKTLDNRIADMKKTLQRELQTSTKADLSSAEEQDISRRYLKHVVLRFLTAREIEARQLTRALSVLLRLSAHEEAMLRAALPPRSGISSWLPSMSNT